MDIFGQYFFTVRVDECAPTGCATLPTLCNYLQEAASLNAEAFQFSKSDFEASGTTLTWVLTHLKVQVLRYPRWKEKLCVRTWARGARRIVAWRDFEVLDEAGKQVALASSEWMVMDLATRKIHPVPEALTTLEPSARGSALGENPFSKVRWTGAPVENQNTFRALRKDIDLNGHVNNVHSIAWVLECLPETVSNPTELEVVFRSEIFVGNDVIGQCVETQPCVYTHLLSSPEGREHVLALTKFALSTPQ